MIVLFVVLCFLLWCSCMVVRCGWWGCCVNWWRFCWYLCWLIECVLLSYFVLLCVVVFVVFIV